MKNLVIIFLLVMLTDAVTSQSVGNPATDSWNGYERINFDIDGHRAYYVKPLKPLSGSLWVWRASFPDWHTTMDSLLLASGFYIAYISVDDEYGSPRAMLAWDKFYKYLTDSISLAPMVSLEAVSRGGLYAYNWAKRHPHKINCIYAEAPVCDIKSWPGGKGKGRGDSSLWKQLLTVYGFDESQAMAFKNNPVDSLEALALSKVPLINIISNSDSIVPVKENTWLLAERYQKAGGRVMVVQVTSGPQELYNHHFPIEGPEWLADLIIKFSSPVEKEKLPGNSTKDLRSAKPNKKATIGFLYDPSKAGQAWADDIRSYLTKQFPQTQFEFVKGIPAK